MEKQKGKAILETIKGQFKELKWLPIVISFILGVCLSYFWAYKAEVDREKHAQKINSHIDSVSQKRDLVLIGSGTVMKYLKSEAPNTFLKAHFFSGPSQIGLELLLSNVDKLGSFPLISMSSSKFDSIKVKELKESFKNEDILYYLGLGEDELRVVTYSTSFDYFGIGDVINLEDLKSKLVNNRMEFDLYITNQKSGTRLEFEEYLDVENLDTFESKNKPIEIFDETSLTIIEKRGRNALILGSAAYIPKLEDKLKDKATRFKTTPILHQDDKGRTVKLTRKLGFYFVEDTDIKRDEKSSLITIHGKRNDFFTNIVNEIKKLKKEGNIWRIKPEKNGVIEVEMN